MLRSLPPLFIAGLTTLSSMAAAQVGGILPVGQPASTTDDIVRLSDDERAAVLDRNTVESAAAARGEMAGPDRAKLEVHGEVSAFVGSNGSRGIAGTAAVPLGDHAGAVVSFKSSGLGYRR